MITSVYYNNIKLGSADLSVPVTVAYGPNTLTTLQRNEYVELNILGEDNLPKILSYPIMLGGAAGIWIPDTDSNGVRWVFEHNIKIQVTDRSGQIEEE